jgi:hypothetical protein
MNGNKKIEINDIKDDGKKYAKFAWRGLCAKRKIASLKGLVSQNTV